MRVERRRSAEAFELRVADAKQRGPCDAHTVGHGLQAYGARHDFPGDLYHVTTLARLGNEGK